MVGRNLEVMKPILQVQIDPAPTIHTIDLTIQMARRADLQVIKDQRQLLQRHTQDLQVLQLRDHMIVVQEPVVAALVMVQALTIAHLTVAEVLQEVQAVAHRAAAVLLHHLLLAEVLAEAQVEARDNILKDFSPLIFLTKISGRGFLFSKLKQSDNEKANSIIPYRYTTSIYSPRSTKFKWSFLRTRPSKV
jgi:hypothetical protein